MTIRTLGVILVSGSVLLLLAAFMVDEYLKPYLRRLKRDRERGLRAPSTACNRFNQDWRAHAPKVDR